MINKLGIVKEEAFHYSLLEGILKKRNVQYGDMTVHNKLWTNCINTKDDLTGRLVVIALVQEARGLDAGPKLVSKLENLKDKEAADIMRRIVSDEVK